MQPEAREMLSPYMTAAEVARSVGWTRRRAARWLERAGVTTVPSGRRQRVVSTELLRVHLPDVYDALLLAARPAAGA